MLHEQLKRVRTVRIHPAVGIARVGNSPDHFVGPELPGVVAYPVGGYRDDQNRLKRQAARFRLFGYDDRDRSLGEVTSADAVIEWRVHLMNTKAAGPRFRGVGQPMLGYRNEKSITKGIPREQFILDGGSKTVSARRPENRFACTHFMGKALKPELELGKLFYEEDSGRLQVVGGHGISASPVHASLREDQHENAFANHDGWYDDVSDGPVTCTVRLKEGNELYVKPAWVVVAPPKFAPELLPLVTLWDTLFQVAIDRSLIPEPFSEAKFRPSFNQHIYPILRRALDFRWVYAEAFVGHTPLFVEPGEPNERLHVFRQLRVPSGHPMQPGTGTGRMPAIWSDLYLEPSLNGTLTRFQYRVMQCWAEGDFDNDWNGKPPSLEYRITPEGLDRAALEPCVGAAFFPGIEVSWKMRDVFAYEEPFRLDHNSLCPGDITQQMSLPWQSDFVACAYESPYVWWPSQRPIDVRRAPDAEFRSWAQSFMTKKGSNDMDVEEMVKNFARLGHVLRLGTEFLEWGRVDHAPVSKKRKARSP